MHKPSTLFQSICCGLFVIACIGGCEANKRDYAEAILRVNREAVAGSSSDFQIYKETQASLLKSTFVVSRALRSNDLPRDLTIEDIRSAIEIDVKDHTELIVIRLPIGNRNVKQAEAILDEVIRAYQSEVLNKERLEKVESLANVRKRYQVLYDCIVEETEQINVLAKQLGSTETLHAAVHEKLHFEVGKSHLLYLKQRLVGLQLERLDEPEVEDESSSIDAKIEFVSKLVTDQKDQLSRFGGTSGELQAKVEVLAALKATLKRTEEDKAKLEIQLEGRGKVYVIQKAMRNS